MQIDVAAHIEKLLFLHDTLTIPSFGGFTAMRAPAAVDYAGGALTPPSKTLTFNENLSVDDGILVEDISKSYSISADEARAAIQAFVDQIQTQLNQREIVTLSGVGRLYKNYVQKIQFLPDSTNFRADSYGLPPLQFSPIVRSREVTEKPATAPAETGGASSSSSIPAEPAKPANAPVIPPLPPPPAFINEPYTAPRSSSAQLGTGIGIGLLVCAIGFGIWWWQHKRSLLQDKNNVELTNGSDSNPSAGSPLSGVAEIAKLAEKKEKNTAKTEKTQPEPADEDLNDDVEEATAQKVEVLRRQNEAPPSAAPAPTPKAESRHCILIIATLQDRNNADRLIAKLKGAGYDVYYRQIKGHQVGIQFDYTDPADVTTKRDELVRFTGEKGIFIKQK